MSNDRYAAWIADQIAQHEPSADHNAMVRLAEATAALTTGAGMVFGMMMPPELTRQDELREQALAVLRQWIPRLDERATEQLADVATRAHLPLDLGERRAEHAAARRAKLDERIAASSKLDARFTELERSIVENPEDRDAWLVLADFQQSKGDPRGELIALQLAAETDPRKQRLADAYLEKHAEVLIGALAPYRQITEGSKDQRFAWRRGYVGEAAISCPDDESASEILELLLRHPAGRFLTGLTIGFDGAPGDSNLESVINVLGEQMVPSLRDLFLGDFEYPEECEISWFEVGDLSPLWHALPRLRSLIVQGNVTLGEISHDKLEHLEVRTGGLPSAAARSVSAAQVPAIRHLEVWYGSETYGGTASFLDVAPLLARHDLPALRHLGLKNCEFTDELCDGIASSRLLRQLEVLDLSMGTMSDIGVDAIVQHAAAFKHLTSIDVSKNWISTDGIARLRKIGVQILDAEQQDGDEGDRYVSVGE